MNKKRYAGLLWTKVEKYDKMDTKGLETVRRDNCLLVRKVRAASFFSMTLSSRYRQLSSFVEQRSSPSFSPCILLKTAVRFAFSGGRHMPPKSSDR